MAALLAVVAFSAGTVRAQDPPPEPDYVSGEFAILPGQWVPLDWTTDIDQDGTWMAVGQDGDVWIVTDVASDPRFTFLGYLSQQNINAAQAAQVPPPQDPTAPNVPKPAPPPGGAPPLPLPPAKPPTNPQTDPEPFGALGGGPIIPNPNTIPAEYPLPGGIRFVVPQNGEPYYAIPLYPNGEIRLYPRPDGKWAIRIIFPRRA